MVRLLDIPETKMIGGERWYLYSPHNTKLNAQKAVKKLRKQGYRARLVTVGGIPCSYRKIKFVKRKKRGVRKET